MEGQPKFEAAPELAFAHLAPRVWEELQKLQRSGWVKRGIEDPETDAEHVLALKCIARTPGEFSDAERGDLKEFFDYAQKYITHPLLLARMNTLETEWKTVTSNP